MSTIQAKDLTKEFPRSPYDELAGFPWLPRLVDKVRVITVHPDLENRIAGAIDRQPGGTYLNLEPEVLHRMLNSLTRLAGDMAALGATPLVLTSPAIRPYFKRLTERTLPKLIVLSYNEIDPNLELEAVGMVNA